MSEITSGYTGHDIRYRGFLTSRSLRLVALFCMTMGQFSVLGLLGQKISQIFGTSLFPVWAVNMMQVLQYARIITIPLLLIAMFTDVLRRQENFIKALINYFVLATITYLAITLILYSLIRIYISAIPLWLRDLDSNEKVMLFLQRFITKVFQGILPGDGTININRINSILATFGSKLELPSISQIGTIAEGLGVPKEIPDLVFKLFAMIPPEKLAQAFLLVFHKLMGAIPASFVFIYEEQITPMICTKVAASLNINVFWDLFLYTLAYFFIAYKPKKLSNSLLMLFRCCAALPISWIVISFLVTGTSRITNDVHLPIWVAVLMSRQSLSSVVIFLALMMAKKFIEASYLDHYHTHEGLEEYAASNIQSLSFSIFMSVLLILVSLADWGLSYIPGLSHWGIGNARYLWMGIPFLMIFSYNKKPKHKIFNVAVPLYYVVHYFLLIVFVTYGFGELLLFLGYTF